MIASAKKGTGLHDLLNSYDPQMLEELRPVQSYPSAIAQAYHQYEHLLHLEKVTTETYKSISDVLGAQELQILVPLILQRASLYLSEGTIHISDVEYRTDGYLTYLIQHSFNNGHNNFYLPFSPQSPLFSSHWHQLKLQGEELRPLQLTLDGYLGTYAFPEMNYGDITVTGSVHGGFAQHAKNSRFSVGSATEVGSNAQDCFFKIKQWSWQAPNLAPRNCTFEIERVSGRSALERLCTQDCTFIFHQEKDAIRASSPHLIAKGNRIIFRQPDGSQKIMRDKNE